MGNKKRKYVSQKKIAQLEKTHEYIMLLGERSCGKSFATKNHCITRAIESGGDEMFIYLRRYDADTKDSLCVGYFADVPVYEMTKGMYDTIDVYRKGIYLANIDQETGKITNRKKIGFVHALNNSERYKSLMFPKVERIIYEEFISMNGQYLPAAGGEPDLLEQYVSTIFRHRKGHVFLIGNLISRICPYYRKWSLDIKNATAGGVQEYVFKSESEGKTVDTRLCVYMTDSLNYNSGMFFGSVAKSITQGAYECTEQPHLPEHIGHYNKVYTVVMQHEDFMFLMYMLVHKEHPERMTWYVEPKTKPEIKKNTRVISSQFSDNILWTNSFEPLSKQESYIFSLLDDDKICFSDNLTGTEFKNILKNYL